MTPKETKEFHKACTVIRKHIPTSKNSDDSAVKFEIVVMRIVSKALEDL